jgi:hypothetical protein
MSSVGTYGAVGWQGASIAARNPPALGSAQRLGLIALGVLWLIDGALQFQPYFFDHFIGGVIAPNATGQPGIIGAPITLIAKLLKPVQVPFNAFAATIEVAIGVALLTRRAIRPVLLVSFAWAFGIWFAGEGVGRIFTSATPNAFAGVIGTAPLYILAGLLVWPREAKLGQTSSTSAWAGRAGARVMWALLWLAGAALWLFPANDGPGALRDLVSGAPAGAGWLSSLQSTAATAVAGDGRGLSIALAIVSAAIGASVMSCRTERAGLIASIPLLLIGWVLVEGFGAVFTGTATDVGTGPVMMLIALELLALSAQRVSEPGRVRAAGAGTVA